MLIMGSTPCLWWPYCILNLRVDLVRGGFKVFVKITLVQNYVLRKNLFLYTVMNNHRKAYAHLKRAQQILEYGQSRDFGMMKESSKRPPPERKGPECSAERKHPRVDPQPSRPLELHASCLTKHQYTDSKTGVGYRTDAYNKDVDKYITLTPPFSIEFSDSNNNEISIRTNEDTRLRRSLIIDHEGKIQIHDEEGKYKVDTPGVMREIFFLTAEMIKLQLTQLQESDEFKFLQDVLANWPAGARARRSQIGLGQAQVMNSVQDQLMEVESGERAVRQLRNSTTDRINILMKLHKWIQKAQDRGT